MKKLVVLIVVGVLIFSLFAVPSVSAIDANLSFDKENYRVYVNETIQVAILLNANNSVGGLQFNVTWNPEYLEFVSYTVGDAGVSAFPTINDQHADEGYIRAGFMNPQGIPSGELLILTFKGKAEGNTKLTINIEDASDTSANPIEAVGGTATVTIQKAVIANFTFSPDKPAVGQEVTFDASSSQVIIGTITEYSWSFGDGKTASGKIVTHKYTKPGSYNVTLTVIGDGGSDSITKQINVINHAPEIREIIPIIVNSSIGHVKFKANVTDYDIQFGVDRIITYIWDFGDGKTATTEEPVVEHYYARGGNYTVTLTVKDSFGEVGTRNVTFTLRGVITSVEESIEGSLEYELNLSNINYLSIPLEYSSAIQYIGSRVQEYLETNLTKDILNKSEERIWGILREYINTSEEIQWIMNTTNFTKVSEKLCPKEGEWNITFKWSRNVVVIGFNKTNTMNKVRVIINENLIVNLTVKFHEVEEENAPQINIISPVATIYNVTKVPIKVNITDDSQNVNVTAFLDGKEITLTFNTTSGLYETIASSLINGSHVLKVYARDEYGNLGVAEVYFVTHEAVNVSQVQVGNISVTVGVIGNATVMSTNETIVVNATVDGTEVTVEIPVTENVTNIVVNTTAIENVVKGEENATLVAGWNATIVGEPKVELAEEEEMQDKKKIIKEKAVVEVNVTMGDEGLAILAVPVGDREITKVKTLKEDGTEIELTTNRSAEVGYYYVENGILFIVLKKDPTVIVEAEKVVREEVVQQTTTNESFVYTINLLYYFWYNREVHMFNELYNKSIELGIDNETIQEALHYKQMAEQYYDKASEFGPIIKNLSNPRILPHLRKAYLNIKKAMEILEKAIEEAENS